MRFASPQPNAFTYFMPSYSALSADMNRDGLDRHGMMSSASKNIKPSKKAATPPKKTQLLQNDYEVWHMSAFLSCMAAEIVTPSVPATPNFEKFVSQILASTQLPSASILLGLLYLTAFCKTAPAAARVPGSVYHLLICALVVANKFLDDNTFTNKSWSEISGLSVKEISSLERQWLITMGWDLHLSLEDQKKWHLWLCTWRSWEARLVREESLALQRSQSPFVASGSGLFTPASTLPLTPPLTPSANAYVPATAGDYHDNAWAPRKSSLPRRPQWIDHYALPSLSRPDVYEGNCHTEVCYSHHLHSTARVCSTAAFGAY